MSPFVWTTLVCASAAVVVGGIYLVWARAGKKQRQE
jgi:hypothetical protein